MNTPPNVMVALDLNRHWARFPGLLTDRLKRAGCTHYKVHDPFPTMDLRATAQHLRLAVLPGTSATVMLDNKEHDIPSRVLKAVERHIMMGFHLTTVHAMAGRDVLTALERGGFSDYVVAVTTLTSAKERDLKEIHGKGRAELELLLGRISFDCGIKRGIVCSAPGIPALQKYVQGVPFMTPGINLPGKAAADQDATATPAQAVAHGASTLILGRTIIGTEESPEKHPEYIFTEVTRQVAEAAAA